MGIFIALVLFPFATGVILTLLALITLCVGSFILGMIDGVKLIFNRCRHCKGKSTYTDSTGELYICSHCIGTGKKHGKIKAE